MSNSVVHLVGSIPLDNAEEVFRTVSKAVGPHLVRLPDGETGKRIGWIRFFQEYLNTHRDMETDPETPPLAWRQWDGQLLREIPRAKFRDGVDPDQVTFTTGYGDSAKESFATFDRLQADGVIPAGVRFQVSLPTPLAPAYNFVAPRALDDFIPVYTRHVLEEVAEIATLPHERLSIQWDVCQEVLMWERYFDYQRPDYKDEILSILGRIGDAVPPGIELGYHLCYGSPRDEHLVQPRDTANMVEIMHGIQASVKREITFFHIPVPRDRDDDAYFAPLAELSLSPETELYMGCLHPEDPVGNLSRLKRALAHVRVDGIGSECGWGRSDPGRIPGNLEAHAIAAVALEDQKQMLRA